MVCVQSMFVHREEATVGDISPMLSQEFLLKTMTNMHRVSMVTALTNKCDVETIQCLLILALFEIQRA